MNVKINENYNFSNDNFKKSYVWLYLKDEVNTLLSPTIDNLKVLSFDQAYVYSNNRRLENILNEFYTKKSYEQSLCLTGLTGAGKSTLLKKVFRIFHNVPIIKDNSLIVPFNFDNFKAHGDVTRIENRMTDMILSATDCIKDEQNLDDVFNRPNEFVKFVKRIHSEIFFFNNKLCKTDEERVEQLYKEKKYEYAMLTLKYYLIDPKNKINNIIFILDDIESIGYDLETQSIITMFKMIECMHNIPSEFKNNYNTNFICSCRHFIYRILVENRDSAEYRIMESYSEMDTLDVSNHLNIYDIIKKRAECILEQNFDTKKELAFKIIKDIIIKINDNSYNFILHLNLNNIRKSMNTLKKLIFNYTWIQRENNELISGAFTIDNYNQFNVYFPNILRALCCGNAYIYSSKHSCVPNLLSNNSLNINMILELLIIKYLINIQQGWLMSFDLDVFYDNLNNIFDNNDELNKSFKLIIYKMLIDRLLLRGCDASGSDMRDITFDNFNTFKKVYISDLTSDLWNLLGANSILLQSYLDDIYLPSSLLDEYDLSQYHFDFNKFELCCDVLQLMITQELTIVNLAKNVGKIEDYHNCFSRTPVTYQVYNGLEKSIDKFFSDEELNGQNYYNIKSKLNKCKKLLDDSFNSNS